MGMQIEVQFSNSSTPRWLEVRDLLANHGVGVQMRMINGSLAFPDELPPDEWSELRIGTTGGMITLRRTPTSVTAVTWGNADESLLASWHAVTWAFAKLGNGTVLTDSGPLSADQFYQVAQLSFS
jgi:hypothetical protein